MTDKFNLSEKVWGHSEVSVLNEKGEYIDLPILNVEDVREFIRLLKEEVQQVIIDEFRTDGDEWDIDEEVSKKIDELSGDLGK